MVEVNNDFIIIRYNTILFESQVVMYHMSLVANHSSYRQQSTHHCLSVESRWTASKPANKVTQCIAGL